jgi:Periplasmic copper-binding protein (NosD)
MLRIPFKLMLALLISAFVFAFGAQELYATTTYIVGTCKAGVQYITIQEALDASPSANVIEVCPGTYPEQLTIINAVTLEGIVANNSSAIRITPPAGGLATNATINGSDPAAVHVFVKNATGAVNLTNLIVDSTNNLVPVDVFLVGILYQHSPGTVNHVIAVHQQANGLGYGIYMEGGTSNPTVTVENCSVHDFDFGGIYVTGPLGPTDIAGGAGVTGDVPTGQLTAKVENNIVASLADEAHNMLFGSSTLDTVTGNLSIGPTNAPGDFGMTVDANAGSVISGNTIIGTQTGINLEDDGPFLKTNKMYVLSGDGIFLTVNLKTSQITGNIIQDTLFDGINLNCKTVGTLVHSNTFNYLASGYIAAPTGFAGSNTYIATQIDASTCP